MMRLEKLVWKKLLARQPGEHQHGMLLITVPVKTSSQIGTDQTNNRTAARKY